MRKTFTLSLALLMAFMIFNGGKLMADPMNVYFPTLGNCYLCKLRIEAAVNELQGIHDVTWDYETKITTVTYDDNILDPFIIMDAIARVGHDTEWYPAPDSAYNALIGTCCEYERTMDYTNVQIGYLSMMDLWVFHVGLDEMTIDAGITVYPSAGNGTFNFNFSGLEDYQGYELSVYSMSGALAFRTQVEGTASRTIDLSRLQNGQYIVVLSGRGSVLARTKLIKQ